LVLSPISTPATSPAFIEELARNVTESSSDLTAPLSSLTIPETLQDSLMARLDRLGDAKQVAQLGAALGREFTYPLLEAIAPLKEMALREGLGRLVEAELVYRRGLLPAATYTFKHALVQETAYESLLEGQRRELHGRIAAALEEYFPERVTREPETLAQHFEAAGRPLEAVVYYQRAGRRAAGRFAHAEAIEHLSRGVALLLALPETAEREQRELKLLVALGRSLEAMNGATDPEVERVYLRASELCQRVGELPELLTALSGLTRHYEMRGELRAAYDLGKKVLGLAEQASEVPALLHSHAHLGLVLANMGEPRQALEHLERAIDLEDSTDFGPSSFGIHIRSYAARTLFVLGHPDSARRRIAEAIELGRERDPAQFALLLAFAAALHYRLREPDRAREVADEAIAIAEEGGFPFPLALATAYRGGAIGGVQGLEEIQRGSAQFVALGADASRPHGLLAEAYQALGRMEDALAELEAALGSRSEARTFDAELYRVQGQVFFQRDQPKEAERSFRRALEVSREQQARALELRAATSLARLLRDQGRRDEARALLQPVYDWFTEGFDTADLKDAKALIGEL
jgi:tetratricopeptide (TPR) repeat protein